MADIRLEGVAKTYPDGTEAVPGVDLAVADGELLVLVGPSGCGKSTLLRLVAGLEAVTRGTLRIGGRVVNALSPQARNVAMVFQAYALYPHMTVRGNLDFPLRMRGMGRRDRARRIAEVAALLGIEPLLGRRPAQLSGGQRQRVAMGRALVREPDVFLMDEPLSNLDAELRVRIRAEIAALQRRLGITTVYVTHDQTEAMSLGHRVAVLRDGRIEQAGSPQEVYDRPATAFVAGFLGSPGMNLLPGRLEADAGGARLLLGEAALDLPGAVQAPREVLAGLRPEALRLPPAPGDAALPARVEALEELGHEVLVHARLPGAEAPLTARAPHGTRAVAGEQVALGCRPEALHLFDPASGARLPVA